MKTRKIRMKTRYANGVRSIEPDHEADLPEAEAKDLIEKGFAVDVDEDPSHGDAKPATKRNARRQPATPRKGAQPPAEDPPAEDPPGDGDTDDDADGDEQ